MPSSALSRILLPLMLLASIGHGQLTPTNDAYTDTAAPTVALGAKPTAGAASPAQTSFITFDRSSIPPALPAPASRRQRRVIQATPVGLSDTTAPHTFGGAYVNVPGGSQFAVSTFYATGDHEGDYTDSAINGAVSSWAVERTDSHFLPVF